MLSEVIFFHEEKYPSPYGARKRHGTGGRDFRSKLYFWKFYRVFLFNFGCCLHRALEKPMIPMAINKIEKGGDGHYGD